MALGQAASGESLLTIWTLSVMEIGQAGLRAYCILVVVLSIY